MSPTLPASFVVKNITLFSLPEAPSTPVKNAWDIFARDFAKVFGAVPAIAPSAQAQIRIGYDSAGLEHPESFALRFEPGETSPVLTLTGRDDLGLIYGLLHLSEHMLGVDPFWFWTDKEPKPMDEIRIPAEDYTSPVQGVRYRGWFVNDEVCLIGWTESYPPPASVWAPVFETLLRLGGNLVTPGTDLPRDGIQTQLAADMGLYITQHHAEPLGAEMFFRAYPNEEASFDRNGALFEGLWRDGIERQKHMNIVWTLGFRGQGDCPFWEQDPAYDTPERQGELIGRAIRQQYDMLQSALPGAPCVTHVYGEIAELYRASHITFPEGVTKIWADNGYGRMVTRRQHNQNFRVPALPRPEDEGPHGIYYHATFHDLQASSHLTMLPVQTGLLVEEMEAGFAAGADEFLLINSGNIRPHIYTLKILAELWRDGTVDATKAPEEFAKRYFPAAADAATACLKRYFNAAIAYGPNEDDRAGDEFYHHPARMLAGHLMRGEVQECAEDLLWATCDLPFRDQIAVLERETVPAIDRFAALEHDCATVEQALPPDQARLFRDFLTFQVQFHRSGAEGLTLLCRGLQAALDGQHPQAFVYASQSLWAYRESLQAMQDSEHGKWKDFFRADWLTNVKSTLYTLQALRMYFRMFGDNPDYFLWHKAYLMPESEKKIYLENTHRNPPDDDDLARRLQAHFGM